MSALMTLGGFKLTVVMRDIVGFCGPARSRSPNTSQLATNAWGHGWEKHGATIYPFHSLIKLYSMIQYVSRCIYIKCIKMSYIYIYIHVSTYVSIAY